MIAGRERMLERQEVLWSHFRPKYWVGLIAKQTFKIPYAGLADLVSASVHLNNVQAKKSLVPVQIGQEFWAAAKEHKVDIVGWDLNMGTVKFCDPLMRHGGGVVLRSPPEQDCAGFVIPCWSQLARHRAHCRYVSFFGQDLGFAPRDSDSHYLITGIFTAPDTRSRGDRNPETLALARRRQEAARKARKAAAKAASAGST